MGTFVAMPDQKIPHSGYGRTMLILNALLSIRRRRLRPDPATIAYADNLAAHFLSIEMTNLVSPNSILDLLQIWEFQAAPEACSQTWKSYE
jgi:hypothetical protein